MKRTFAGVAAFAFALAAVAFQPVANAQQPVLGSAIGAAMPAAQRAQRDAVIDHVLDKSLGNLNDQLKKNINNVSTRDLSNAALYLLVTGQDTRTVEILLRKLFSIQNMDSSSSDFGNIPWGVNNPAVRDANSIEFDMQPIGVIFKDYGDKLSKGFVKDATPHLQAALNALAHHRVSVSYTNIYLMNTMNTLAIGEYLKNEAAQARGRQQWQAWRTYTSQYSIHEFDSPTYYGVDLGDLTLGYRAIADPQIHNEIRVALDYFWKDIAANFFLPAERIAGPHGRDYNFLRGWGGIGFYLYAEGVVDDQNMLTEAFLEKTDAPENDRPGGYHPSPEILRLMAQPYRVVEQRWDAEPARSRYTYLAPEFAMGSTNGLYSPQDKLFAADYAAPSPVITTSIVPDTFDAPYGLSTQVDGSGHSKPMHIPANLSSAQEKGTALLVYDLNPNRDAEDKLLATNLLLPATAQNVLLDGKEVAVSATLDQPAALDSVVAVRQDNACLAAKVWHADPLDGNPPSVRLKADQLGFKRGAFRLVVYHGQVSDKSDSHLHVAVLVAMQKCSGENDLRQLAERVSAASVKALPGTDRWTATAEIGDLKLRVVEDTARRMPVERSVNGKEMETPVFAVNGTAIPF